MDTIDARSTALLVVHLQNDIAAENGAFGGLFIEQSRANGTLGKAAALADVVREAGGSVVYLRIGFDPGYDQLVPNVPLLAMVKQFGAAVNGTWQTEIVDEVAPKDGDLVLTHTRTSPFQDSPLDRMLRARGVDTVIVCGIATNASVEDAARHAANLGYRTIISSDASSAATLAAHEATLASFELFGEVADTETLAAALSA